MFMKSPMPSTPRFAEEDRFMSRSAEVKRPEWDL